MILGMNPPKGNCEILMDSRLQVMFLSRIRVHKRVLLPMCLCFLYYKAAGRC